MSPPLVGKRSFIVSGAEQHSSPSYDCRPECQSPFSPGFRDGHIVTPQRGRISSRPAPLADRATILGQQRAWMEARSGLQQGNSVFTECHRQRLSVWKIRTHSQHRSHLACDELCDESGETFLGRLKAHASITWVWKGADYLHVHALNSWHP